MLRESKERLGIILYLRKACSIREISYKLSGQVSALNFDASQQWARN